MLTEQSPIIGALVNTALTSTPAAGTSSLTPSFTDRLAEVFPYIQDVVKDIKPRILSTLTVAQLVERLTPVAQGKENLMSALNGIKNDATFRIIGDVPVQSILAKLGLNLSSDEDTVAAA
jgi:hypothetical protein